MFVSGLIVAGAGACVGFCGGLAGGQLDRAPVAAIHRKPQFQRLDQIIIGGRDARRYFLNRARAPVAPWPCEFDFRRDVIEYADEVTLLRAIENRTEL